MSEEQKTHSTKPQVGFTDATALHPGDRNGESSSGPADMKNSEPWEKEYFCGCGPCHPPWMQWLRDARVCTLLLCLFATIEGALVSGFTSVVLSTIERRYRLSSTSTGALASMIDVAILVSVVFISYFGGRGHKPRWLGASLIVQGIGALVFALPQFVFGRYEVGDSGFKDVESCRDGNDFSLDYSSSNNAVLAFFMMGNILIGVGAAPLFTVGISYLDEIVNPKYVSIHFGVFYMTAIIGPALGFALGGIFLSVYVDPWVDTHLETSDPGWVGAWWLCYIFSGVMSVVIAIPFFFYPKLPPNFQEIHLLREKELLKKQDAEYVQNGRIKRTVVNFTLAIKGIISTPSWWCITAAIAVATITVSGFGSFGVKYVESQFGLPSSTASVLVGVTAIPSGGAGVVVGGLILYSVKVKGRWVPLMCLLISTLTILPLFGLLIHCSNLDLAGVTVPYPDGTVDVPDTSVLHPNCTASCDCTSSVFEPVCGADNVVYFSPCQAGCPPKHNTSDYTNCCCVTDRLMSLNSSGIYYSGTAKDGLCYRDCRLKLVFYLLLASLALFLVFMLQIPSITITIRCVTEDQRTLALGLQSCLWRVFGSVPGPILFGVLFDSACLFWQRDCGRRGNCWVYDNSVLSTRVMVLAVGAIVGYIFFVFLCWWLYPHQPTTEQEERIPLTEKHNSQ